MQRIFTVLVLAVVAAGMTISAAQAGGGRHLQMYQTQGMFADVKQDILNAVANKGFVVDYVARLGDMLKRTGPAVGSSKPIYEEAEMLQFCSAKYSRAAMEIDPSNIVFCPYVIVVYTLPEDPKTVHVGYRRPMAGGSLASRKALMEIESLLDGVVREALDMN
ncbi:DUF302 domain-containing protein [Magnetospira sp. QH-2]|uniref:DUF302 domain-containing protein n=1 Tax=Magnetospira sp. (strain QH-2) TaxID=1288970 RepID=UPI0003E80E63|nr:DUF302 domain-containing protein [Magnetospira sp. QH-2]CCQ74264.1 Conserved exported protein of unknown function [Magnetospira sp. QH-2]